MNKTKKITRFELISKKYGRSIVIENSEFEFIVQDGGRTLKVIEKCDKKCKK